MAEVLPTSKTPESLESLYHDQIAKPLKTAIEATRELVPQLAALPNEDKQRVADFMAGYTHPRSRSGKEAYVPAAAIETLPVLARDLEALDGFLKVATRQEERPLTQAEIAAATARWEPFDQFAETAQALSAALGQVRGKDDAVVQQLAKVTAATDALYDPLGGRSRDALFLDAVEWIKNGDGTAPHQHAALARPNADQSLLQIYEGQILEPQKAVLEATQRLQQGLDALSPEDKANLRAQLEGYQSQSDRSIDPEKILSSFAAYGDGVKVMGTGMQKAAFATGEGLTPEETKVAGNPSEVFGVLRSPSRALLAALNAANDDGRYDKLLEDAAILTAHSWEVRKAMDGPLAAKVAESVAAYNPAPSTNLTGATAEPVVAAPQQGAQKAS